MALAAEVADLTKVHGTLVGVEDEVVRPIHRQRVVGRGVGGVDLVAGPAVDGCRVQDVLRGPRSTGRDPLQEALVRVARGAAGGGTLEVPTQSVGGLSVLHLLRVQVRAVGVALGAGLGGVLTGGTGSTSGTLRPGRPLGPSGTGGAFRPGRPLAPSHERYQKHRSDE
jgi:hypothetical protein